MKIIQGPAEKRIKEDLLEQIGNLENQYTTIKKYLSNGEYDALEIKCNVQIFKETLEKVSAYVLTLYNLKGQRVKIPWDSLVTNLEYALATMELAPQSKIKTAIQLALNMSEPKIESVLAYLKNLKEFLT